MTWLDLIKGSLRLLQALQMGQGIGSDEESGCLAVLNLLISSWNTERMIVPVIEADEHTLVEGTANYTMGPSGDFDRARPIRVEACTILIDEQRYPLDVLTWERWQVRRVLGAGRPAEVFVDQAYPVSNVRFNGTPDAAYTVEFAIWEALSAAAAVGDTVVLPPGYERALMYNLAVDLATQIPGAKLSQMVVDIAVESKAMIKRLNAPSPELVCDEALVRRSQFDILTGSWV